MAQASKTRAARPQSKPAKAAVKAKPAKTAAKATPAKAAAKLKPAKAVAKVTPAKAAGKAKPAAVKTSGAKPTAAKRAKPVGAKPVGAKSAGTAKGGGAVVVLVATRKGAWLFHGDAARRKWRVEGPHFLGHTVSHMVLDPRDGRTLLAAAKTGHLGPTVFRSLDLGKTWKEAARPPSFARAGISEPPRAVDHTFWLTPGHPSQPDAWYAGTSPQGLFRSNDGGVTWVPVAGLNDNPQYKPYMGSPQDGTPDGPKLHSVIIDPRDPTHIYFAMSSGGVHETRDAGRSWKPLIRGLEVVAGFDTSNPGFHDPHCMRLCPSNPDRLYQQNHCGIYRIDRPSNEWQRIGLKMPKQVGDVGFPMVVHPRNADACWVFPMDGSGVWPRTSPDGKPAVYATRNGGRTWQRLDGGLPVEQAWWTVKRQAMTADAGDPIGLYLGTTSGELWMSRDEGAQWTCVARHLPEIYAVEAAVPR